MQTIRVVPHLDSSQALIFPVMEYILKESEIITIGRSTADRNPKSSQMAFRSKVVSRKHAKIYLKSGKVYIQDIQSSSGTFLNHQRLCPANQISQPFEVHSNDIIQLGVDYQGGSEEIYRCVKMKVEFNKQPRAAGHDNYNLQAFNALRNLTKPIAQPQDNLSSQEVHVDECCICLFAIAPFQALFVAPCSHTFHYKCLRPLLDRYPGFTCPLCRSYADLDASVDVEVAEV
ncbi:SMAD/FHA domain-containing protein [Pilaira anomala]|nr:SMAD/FHA domain-containing protein [Pilaira anomala]